VNLADRLRSIVGSSGASDPGSRSEPEGVTPQPDASTADLLGGDWREWQGHRYLVVDRRYPPGHRHGRVAVADGAPDSGGSWPTLELLAPAAAGGRVLFVDLETTGLSGGAGTYAFLVGCAWFEGAAFRVRQFLLTVYAAERGLLEAMRDTVGAASAVATYNGKSFDLPVLDTRCLLHRMSTLFDGVAHVDMLHPARQLWRTDGPKTSPLGGRDSSSADVTGGCRLATLETSVLGHVRDGDVRGCEIPSRYFQYVRSGDPRPLAAVLEHNRLDLLSLAMLTARLAQLLRRGADAAATAREALGLGRLYRRVDRLVEARACFSRAADMAGDASLRAEALHAYAVLCRRAQQHHEAAGAWREVLALPACPVHVAREAREALAVHCEHRLWDFEAARRLAIESLRYAPSTARTDAVYHRVARLDRKLISPLF
jgi:uncharacterized protein YprB with RNaseH-like and TPR domain